MFSRFSIIRPLMPITNLADGGLINYTQSRGAARKGIRIRRAREARLRAAKRRLLEAQNPKSKKNQAKHIKVDKSQFKFLDERQQDVTLPPVPKDDVYFMKDFRKKRFSFEEAIDFHRQIAHPDVLNLPDTLVSATIELNLKMKIKRKKYIEKIESTIRYPNLFQYQLKPRKIIALCKNEQDQAAAREAGAYQAGALDIANLLKTKQLTQRDFDHLVCHNDFLEEFGGVKGMKGSSFFPNIQRGNMGDNIVELVKYFKDGVDYSLRKSPEEPTFGSIECLFGKLSMTNDQLRENAIALFNSISRFRPLNLADNKQFFERVYITTPISEDVFFIRFWDMVDDYQDPDITEVEEEAVEKVKN